MLLTPADVCYTTKRLKATNREVRVLRYLRQMAQGPPIPGQESPACLLEVVFSDKSGAAVFRLQ
mgnify:CR=1 FL=1